MPIYLKDDKSILFVHVPKTGGSSIEKVLTSSGYQQHDFDGSLKPGSPNTFRRCSPQHWHADLLREIYRIERFTAVFMMVREPVARLRSEFAYQLFWQKRELTGDEVARWTHSTLDAYELDHDVLDNHVRPQSHFWLPEASVYRLEDGIDAAVADLNRRFDLGLSTEAPRLQASHRRNGGTPSHRVPVPDAVRDRVRRFYADDYERFRYP